MTHRPKRHVFTSTAHLFEDKLGVPANHLAQGGRGNIRVVATTKLHFYINKHEIGKETFCVIEWSSSRRKDYVASNKWKALPDQDVGFRTYHSTDNWKFLSNQLDYDIDDTIKINFLLQIIDLQEFFVINNIPYVMFNGLDNNTISKSKSINLLNDQIDRTRFFAFNEMNHYDFIHENNLAISEHDGHPTAKGHKVWFDMLWKFVEENNCMEP